MRPDPTRRPRAGGRRDPVDPGRPRTCSRRVPDESRLRRRHRAGGPRLPAEPRPQRRRPGRRGDLAGARRGPLAARRPHPLPGDPRAARRRGRPHAAGAAAGDGVRRRARRRHLRRPHRPGGRAVPARGRAAAGRRLRPAHHARAAPARPQGGRRPPAAGCASPTRSASPGPNLVGKVIVIDPGHGGPDPGVVVPDGPLRWTEADLAFDLATRLEGRLAAAGMRVHLTRGPAPTAELTDLDARPARQRARRRPADLAAHRRPRQPGGRRRRDLPLRHRQRRHRRPWGSGWPGWCSGRSSRAPGCATAGPTPRPGSCCG